MNIVWMSWKDRSHPLAGGAEIVSGEIMERLVRDGHTVTLLTSRPSNLDVEEVVRGVRIIRAGGRYGVYSKAKNYYKKHLLGHTDLVVDEMNTIPFASGYYCKTQNVLLAYQLARSVWFYQMIFPLSLIGYMAEPIYLRLIAKYYPRIVTESESTKRDMVKYGFTADKIHTFSVGMALQPLKALSPKTDRRMILSLGAMRPMKQTLHAVQAFEIARDKNPELHMVLAGDNHGKYAEKVLRYIKASRHADHIDIRGRVSDVERLELMKSAAVILVTSIKEGWGLIVTEANSQGTPAIVYDTDGLRDSVKDGITGIISPQGDPTKMGAAIVDALHNNERYESLRTAAWEWSKQFSFENSYQSFIIAAGLTKPINEPK